MGIKHIFKVKCVVKHLGEAVLEWGFEAYREKTLYFLVDLPCIVVGFYGEVRLSDFENRTGYRALWSINFFYFLILAVISSSLALCHLSVLGFILMLCLSFPA